MDDTASSFSTRSNAKRAAEQMIAKGTALTVDYDIKPRNGRFEVIWKTALTTAEFAETNEAQVNQASKAEAGDWPNTAATTDKVEVEIATATANADESAASGEPAPITAPPEPQPCAAASTEPEPEPDPFPDGTYVKVRTGKRKIRVGHISHRIDQQHWRVRLLGAADGVTELASAAQLYRAEDEAPAPEEKKPANRQRRGSATGPQKASRSRYAIDPKAIASGKLPAKAPVVTSAANPHYQKHFDRLFALARAGDWDAVRDYKVTGSNSYSKMVARYRQDLLAVHAASEAVP
jgi:hypothetical protein